ncbi:hypothetical protein [Asaia krungthepensis]|uniref:Terminase n=1 Tax=Asaia krungthepensis NRIC 0535 TaxID=1307925 RepID=A0ABQ0Q2L8_9PROT|nr:hypothetical protein [Asaia krungthepensis]GBQ88327.1 hypothetical protein AA0535_1516 [Asaia krungthepensis NRIC 0535]
MNDRLIRRKRPRDSALRDVFLEHLKKAANVSDAARAAGIDRKTAYNWRKGDPLFSESWRLAIEEATDLLEGEARRRAIEGYDEPVLHGGRLVCDAEGQPVTRKRYSDGLLRMLLRAHRPASFGGGRTTPDHDDLPPVTSEGDDAL